jgi:glycosyltransferase involved in cell wall biosynthesis
LTPAQRALHVILVNDFAAVTGGSDRVVVAEAVGLAARGHRVTLVAGHGEPDPALIEAGVEIHTTGQASTIGDPNRLRAMAQGIWNPRAARLLAGVAATAGHDAVIHAHGVVKVLSPSVIRAALASGVPTVATLHDYFAACPNGGFFNYQRGEICRLEPLSARCIATHCDARAYSHKLWRVARSEVQRTAGRMPAAVTRFIVPSQFAGTVMRPHLPDGAELYVVPNAVSVDRRPAADPASGSGFVFIGRLQRDKGPVLFARAAKLAQVPCVFAGDGEEREAIRAANPDARFCGWLDHEELETVVREARAVVNASLWYETQGLSVLEAAAHGVPAIVSSDGALREAVVEGSTGLWFRGGQVEDLAEKLVRLQRHPDLAARLGAGAYERFWALPLDLDSHLDRLEGIYAESLSRDADAAGRAPRQPVP